jgi:hypothetical protein
MLQVELCLLSYGSIGVEGRLNAVPQHSDIHGRDYFLCEGGWWPSMVSRVGELSEVGAVWAVVGLRASSLPPRWLVRTSGEDNWC